MTIEDDSMKGERKKIDRMLLKMALQTIASLWLGAVAVALTLEFPWPIPSALMITAVGLCSIQFIALVGAAMKVASNPRYMIDLQSARKRADQLESRLLEMVDVAALYTARQDDKTEALINTTLTRARKTLDQGLEGVGDGA